MYLLGFPLLLITFAVYNIVAFLMPGVSWTGMLFSVHMVSGADWTMSASDLLLTLATLGGYYFWGKARLQSYLYSQLSLLGDRFAYMGTGWEFLLGWLRALVLFAIVAACHGIAEWSDQTDFKVLGFATSKDDAGHVFDTPRARAILAALAAVRPRP